MHAHDVLVVASRHNREVDGVIDGLRSVGLTVGRFSPCQYPEFDSRTWVPDAPDGTFGRCQAGWLADFSGWSVEKSLTGLGREASLTEIIAFVDGVLLSTSAKWLNAPQSIRTASRKLLQLRRAFALGITTPRTCVTNSVADAKNFISTVGRAIAKPLGASYMTYGDRSLKFYTREVDLQSADILNALSLSPMIFQERIDKTEEVRVTVIDDWAAAVKINLLALNGDVPVDTRQLDYLKYRSHFRPCPEHATLLDNSVRIVRELGLSYGGVDWAIDASGRAYFLECNPMGSFKWFEMCSGENITARLVDALSKRCT